MSLSKNIQVWGRRDSLRVTSELYRELGELAAIWSARTASKWTRALVARAVLTLASIGQRLDSRDAQRETLELHVPRLILHERLPGAEGEADDLLRPQAPRRPDDA